MAESVPNEEWKRVEKVLGEPVFDDFPDDTGRIRRNLLVVSFLTVAYKINGLVFSPDSSIFGIKFDGLTSEVIDQTLFWLVFYHLVHFGWNAIAHLQRWRLRATGTRLAFRTTGKFSSQHGDYPDDPRQSTLYSWWSDQAGQIGNLREVSDEITERVRHWETQIQEALSTDPKIRENRIHNVNAQLTSTIEAAARLRRGIDHASETIKSQRIPVSLKRFDSWFRLFQWNQIIKWLLVELLVPIILGVVAVAMTFPFDFKFTFGAS